VEAFLHVPVSQQLNQGVLILASHLGEPLEASVDFNANHRTLADLLAADLTDLALLPQEGFEGSPGLSFLAAFGAIAQKKCMALVALGSPDTSHAAAPLKLKLKVIFI
jgi:hypothetical protein